jgi:hypothetical protein
MPLLPLLLLLVNVTVEPASAGSQVELWAFTVTAK